MRISTECVSSKRKALYVDYSNEYDVLYKILCDKDSFFCKLFFVLVSPIRCCCWMEWTVCMYLAWSDRRTVVTWYQSQPQNQIVCTQCSPIEFRAMYGTIAQKRVSFELTEFKLDQQLPWTDECKSLSAWPATNTTTATDESCGTSNAIVNYFWAFCVGQRQGVGVMSCDVAWCRPDVVRATW